MLNDLEFEILCWYIRKKIIKIKWNKYTQTYTLQIKKKSCVLTTTKQVRLISTTLSAIKSKVIGQICLEHSSEVKSSEIGASCNASSNRKRQLLTLSGVKNSLRRGRNNFLWGGGSILRKWARFFKIPILTSSKSFISPSNTGRRSFCASSSPKIRANSCILKANVRLTFH